MGTADKERLPDTHLNQNTVFNIFLVVQKQISVAPEAKKGLTFSL